MLPGAAGTRAMERWQFQDAVDRFGPDFARWPVAERLAGEEAVRSVEAMKRADRATRRAKAEREAGGEQHEQHQEYAMGSSASRAGAGDFEVRGGWESRSR